ncbi:hypothetical protein TNCV_1692721 [Trichonephila clavipes]|nr:hypothetical protein TNCV_1692721 [Trichonephila clavipes]
MKPPVISETILEKFSMFYSNWFPPILFDIVYGTEVYSQGVHCRDHLCLKNISVCVCNETMIWIKPNDRVLSFQTNHAFVCNTTMVRLRSGAIMERGFLTVTIFIVIMVLVPGIMVRSRIEFHSPTPCTHPM